MINKKIGIFSSAINLLAVMCFAVSMLIGTNFGSYLSSIFIAFSFVPMICSYAFYAKLEVKLAGMVAVGFAVVYATLIALVYFAQMTTVQAGGLTAQAAALLDFQQFGLFFNYDMLGYAFMALATFFAGLTVDVKSKADRWLKGLLLVHGVFFISCFILPMLGLFTPNGAKWIGIAVLEFWCLYFVPIGILSFFHFSKFKSLTQRNVEVL